MKKNPDGKIFTQVLPDHKKIRERIRKTMKESKTETENLSKINFAYSKKFKIKWHLLELTQ